MLKHSKKKSLRTKGKFKKCKNLWLCGIYGSFTLINTTENLAKQGTNPRSPVCSAWCSVLGKPTASSGTIPGQNGTHPSSGEVQESKQHKNKINYPNYFPVL